ncbi:cell wall hydrolase [Sphingomonas ginkgonis]|uniref:cell wall hydrolase n=1 Tax=Sphingomonas ginkgonis TaxID=2315330 RepID=UPI001C8B85C6|nr:cell wall hydrolase [Sphingomonas ginkgonis]
MTVLTLPQNRLSGVLRDYPREVFSAGLVAAAALVGIASLAAPAASTPRLPAVESAAVPPAVEPMLMRNVAPQTAEQINAAIPLDAGPNPAARPFLLGKLDATTRERATDCLAQAIYYEAGSESVDGQRAVAQVVLNRLRHPAFPKSVCGVVYQGSDRATGCQFTFTCDGSLNRSPVRWAWDRAYEVARSALAGYVFTPVGEATHYHTDWVVPYWSSALTKSAVVGAHIFYRWAGSWGTPVAFSGRYTRVEPDVAALRNAALSTDKELASDNAATGIDAARKELPPELAALLNAEPGLNGQRVEMKLNVAGKNPRPGALPATDPAATASSSNLQWALGGSAPKAEDQKPLGRSATAPAVAAPASSAASSAPVAALADSVAAAGSASAR